RLVGPLDHRDVPERLEDAAGQISLDRLAALGAECIADRAGLCRGRCLPRLLLDWLLLDADQRLAVGAIQEIAPAGLAALIDALTRLSVELRVEQHDRTRGIVVPDVVMDFLEMPAVLAGLVVDRHNRRGEQIVSWTHRP